MLDAFGRLDMADIDLLAAILFLLFVCRDCCGGDPEEDVGEFVFNDAFSNLRLAAAAIIAAATVVALDGFVGDAVFVVVVEATAVTLAFVVVVVVVAVAFVVPFSFCCGDNEDRFCNMDDGRRLCRSIRC